MTLEDLHLAVASTTTQLTEGWRGEGLDNAAQALMQNKQLQVSDMKHRMKLGGLRAAYINLGCVEAHTAVCMA